LINFALKSHFKKLTFTCILLIHGFSSGFANEPITPIYQTKNLDIQKFELGKTLFKETLLSTNQTTSCHSCHDFATGGDDGLQTPDTLSFNSPTIFNVSKNYFFGWRGQFDTLDQHLDYVLANPKVMGADWPVAVKALKQDPIYLDKFNLVYEGDISKETITAALLYFEQNIILPSPFDAFLQGDKYAISASAKKGYKHFKDYGCVSCHQGANVGGNIFQTLGVVYPYKGLDGQYQTKKLRVPSLRNVAKTAPYLHDGSINALNSVIAIMAEYQLGQTLTMEEIDQIAAFLTSLNSITENVIHEKN
jgi:cytochrome c peroxidase